MSSKTCSQYVRVKRKSQTIFLHVEPTDSFALVKEKLGAVRLLPPLPMILMWFFQPVLTLSNDTYVNNL
jgi:hypothetical protein